MGSILVYTTGYSIAWSNELEIDATAIYSDLTGKHFGKNLNPKFTPATTQLFPRPYYSYVLKGS